MMRLIKIGLIITLGMLVVFIPENPVLGSNLIEPRVETQEIEIEENTTFLQTFIYSFEKWEKRLGGGDSNFSIELFNSSNPFIFVSDQINEGLINLFLSATKLPFYILYCSLDID